jgi:hypothetical protein
MTEEKKDVTLEQVYEATKELTKQIAELVKIQKSLAEEIKTKVKAGRF